MLTWALALGRQVLATCDTTIPNEMSLRLTAALLPFVLMSKEVVTLAADAEPPTAKNSAEESRADFIVTALDISGSFPKSSGFFEGAHHLNVCTPLNANTSMAKTVPATSNRQSETGRRDKSLRARRGLEGALRGQACRRESKDRADYSRPG